MTYHPKSDFLRVMFERGFVADCTDYQALDEAFAQAVADSERERRPLGLMLHHAAMSDAEFKALRGLFRYPPSRFSAAQP